MKRNKKLRNNFKVGKYYYTIFGGIVRVDYICDDDTILYNETPNNTKKIHIENFQFERLNVPKEFKGVI